MINDELIKMLKSKSMSLKPHEIEAILDDELNKTPEEMDTELIDLCVDVLEKFHSRSQDTKDDVQDSPVSLNKIDADAHSSASAKSSELTPAKSPNPKKKIYTFKTIAIAVAAVLIICIVSLSAYAAFSNTGILNSIVEMYNKYIVVHFDKSNDTASNYELLGSELAQDLKDNGIHPVLLPEALVSDDATITSIEYQKSDLVSLANINFNYNGAKGNVMIEMFDSQASIPNSEYPNAERFIEINVKNISIYIFDQGNDCTIIYKDGFTIYNIFISMPFNQTVDFAKTLK